MIYDVASACVADDLQPISREEDFSPADQHRHLGSDALISRSMLAVVIHVAGRRGRADIERYGLAPSHPIVPFER